MRRLWLALLLALAPAEAARAAGSMNEVIDCALRSLPPSVRGRFVLTWRSAKGEGRVIEGQYWGEQPNQGMRRVIVASTGARSTDTAAYLFSEGDRVGEAWRWTPYQPSPRRIEPDSPDGELFGTDVDFEDFARFARFMFPGQLRRLPDGSIDGRQVYVVETKPSPDSGSRYERLVSSVDREWCVILRREGYEADFKGGAEPTKVMSASPNDVKIVNGFARVTRATLRDLRDGSQTRAELVDLELEAVLPEGFFEPRNLANAVK